MNKKEYVSLVTNLTALIEKEKELKDLYKQSEYDLKWRLSELYKSVSEEDEEKFIDASGMHGTLVTSLEKKREIEKARIEKSKKQSSKNKETKKISEKIEEFEKEVIDKLWAKKLYKKSVRRCHPDTLMIKDSDYKAELVSIYKNITEAFDKADYSILMTESYKLLLTPDQLLKEQFDILHKSIIEKNNLIKELTYSQPIVWSTLNNEMKENFLINFMKQKGIKFIDKKKIKEVVNRRIPNRKAGQRPVNNLRLRSKKM
jgi:hypothetical protein